MKWRIAYLVFAVVSGLLLTAGNAWTCSALSTGKYTKNITLPLQWPVTVPATWPPPAYAGRGENRWISVDVYNASEQEPPRNFEVMVERTGWPLRLMRVSRVTSLAEVDAATTGKKVVPGSKMYKPELMEYHGAWKSKRGTFGRSRHLGVSPIEPIPVTFIAHWSFFSVLIASPMLWAMGRVWFRRRRNLCPTCAYSLSGLPSSTTSCPECGKPLRAKSAIVPLGGSLPPTPTAANDPAP